MSRIGNKPIPVPAGVKIQIKDDAIEVQGPKGKLSVPLPRGITFEQKDGSLHRQARQNEISARCMAWRAPSWPTPLPASPLASRRNSTSSASAIAPK